MSQFLNSQEETAILDLTRELIRIPSSDKDGPEIYEFAEQYLVEHGIDTFQQQMESPFLKYRQFTNRYARIGVGPGPKIHLNGHLDTVPLREGWLYDPYEATQVDDKLYGVGAADMKAGCAAAIVAFIGAHRRLRKFNGELFLSLVFGEEAPFSLGTDVLLRELDHSDYDLVIVPEPSPLLSINDFCLTHKRIHKASFPVCIIGAEGRVLFELEFIGRSAHASHPSQGINALHDAAKLITELAHFDLFEHLKMGRGHYCVINCEGGSEQFTVPGTSKILLNRQLTLGENDRTVFRELKSIIRKLKLRSKVSIQKRFSPDPELEYQPYLSEESPYIAKFRELINRDFLKNNRRKNCLFTTTSVGDFNLFGHRLKVPTIVFGPGGGSIHGLNEFVNVSELIKTGDYLLGFLLEVFGA